MKKEKKKKKKEQTENEGKKDFLVDWYSRC
jgi:hypothetical protein